MNEPEPGDIDYEQDEDTLRELAAAYEAMGDTDMAAEMEARADALSEGIEREHWS